MNMVQEKESHPGRASKEARQSVCDRSRYVAALVHSIQAANHQAWNQHEPEEERREQ